MIQFYFLSVFLNILAGYILVTGDDNSALEFKSGFSLKDETFKLIVGILSVVTGLLKLLSAIEGDIPVLGDLVPVAAGFLSGFILIFEYYRSHSTLEESEKAEKIERLLISNKRIVGFIVIIAAVLHFLFPRVLLL